MIIDAHAHVALPDEMYDFFRGLSIMGGGRMGPIRGASVSDERLEECLKGHLAEMDAAGTDLQLISPEPWVIPTAERRTQNMVTITRQLNDAIARCVKLHPDRFAGVAAVPQSPGFKPRESVKEIERSVNELGFVGIVLNPDPGEGGVEVPHMGDDYWYPIYEKMCELDVPALIHAGNCRFARQPIMDYQLQEENVTTWGILRTPELFRDFPDLKLIVAHGGGYVPYQFGRGRSFRLNEGRRSRSEEELETFEESIGRLYFDTVLYDSKALSLLFRLVGPDRCLFGSDQPEYSSVVDPKTERSPHDIRPYIESIDWLSDADKSAIFEQTARTVFSRLQTGS
jgi:4-oxalmesaconate hydratase